MLSKEQVQSNKEKFINLIKSITREGMDTDRLINKLEHSDFFTAPCSTVYHNAYEGGLCEHSLNVYNRLCKLIDIDYPKIITDALGQTIPAINNSCPFTDDTLKIVALLHDISKMNFYEVAERNAKDEKGNWIKVPFIKVKDAHDRFLFSNHEMNSLFMIQQFVPLTVEESAAIANHMGGKSEDSAKTEITAIYNKYPLATYLHLADMSATFIDERL